MLILFFFCIDPITSDDIVNNDLLLEAGQQSNDMDISDDMQVLFGEGKS